MPRDWQTRYGNRPLLLETLVNAARFRGTCDRGASWKYVGRTAGRGRMDREHKSHGQSTKDIYLYPLICDADNIYAAISAGKQIRTLIVNSHHAKSHHAKSLLQAHLVRMRQNFPHLSPDLPCILE
jgi:hypothetical protein